jgi:hypothetical protein
MFYETSITIPAATAETSPTEVELKLTAGIIHTVELDFPHGCAHEARLRLFHQEHQLFPTNPSGYHASDGHVIVIRDHFHMKSAPYTLEIRGYSPDGSYAHTIRVRVGVLPSDLFGPAAPKPGVREKLVNALLGKPGRGEG